jgi:hypothetical protein
MDLEEDNQLDQDLLNDDDDVGEQGNVLGHTLAETRN